MARISKWQQGVALYASELREHLAENSLDATKENMLNGADNWEHYSIGGSSLIFDDDIAERLATPSEVKKRTLVDGLSPMANSNESWLDVQARALYQASLKVIREGKK